MTFGVLNETPRTVAAASAVLWAVLVVPVSAQNPPEPTEPAPAPPEVSGDDTPAPAPNAAPSLNGGFTVAGEWLGRCLWTETTSQRLRGSS